jgi:hypothetical protein
VASAPVSPADVGARVAVTVPVPARAADTDASDAHAEWSELARPDHARTMRAVAIGGGGGLALSLLGVILLVSARGRSVPSADTTAPAGSSSTPVAAVASAIPPPAKETVEPAAPTTAPAARPLGNDAELTVACEPTCSLVLIDGKRMKSYPGPARVRPGRHGIGVARPGYSGNWKLVTLRRGQAETVSFTLTPAPGAAKPCAKPGGCK